MKLNVQHADGAQNEIHYYSSETSDAPLVLISPAMGLRASYYKAMAENFAAQGIDACTADYRGTGLSSLRASRKVDFGYETLVSDLRDVVKKLKEQFPDKAIFLLGHSLGGQIGGLYMSRYPGELRGLILIAACMVYYKGWKEEGMARVKMAVNLFPLLAKSWGYFPGKSVGFGGREARTVLHDWGLNGRKGIYAPKGSNFDYEAALKKFDQPLLAMSLEGDDFAPKLAVAGLVQKLGPDSQNKNHLHISRKEAGIGKMNHFNWVKQSDFFVKRVGEWIEERT